MARPFQLVFRSGGTERTEMLDANSEGDPQIDGRLVVAGETYAIRGVDWLLTADDLGDTKRFLCTLVAEATEPTDSTADA